MRQILVICFAVATLAIPGRGSAQRVSVSNDAFGWSSADRNELLVHPTPMWNATPLRLGGTIPMRVSWTRTEIALAGGFTAALLADAGQTRGLARGGWQSFHETNPLLGSHPSVARINVYTAVAGVTVLGAAAMAPARLRPWVLGAAFVIEALTVARNAQAGITLSLPY
jgi:uncharacterized membrane protein